MTRCRLGPRGRAHVDRAAAVIEGLRSYWPLTLRQVYYQLVASTVIGNCLAEYKRLSDTLTKARLEGLVPWQAIEDRSRSILWSGGWTDRQEFTAAEIRSFLADYSRDLLQSQPVALEIWVEKDALAHVVHRAARPFCVPVVVAKGYASMSYKHECRQRIERDGRPTRILYFGDLDPSGVDMLPAMLKTLQGEMGLGERVQAERCALNPGHVEAFNLPRSVDALKHSDTRTPAYVRQYGDLAVELDALSPPLLETMVREAIERNLDLSAFEIERHREREERLALAAVRGRVQALVRKELG